MEPILNNVENPEMGISSSSYLTSVKHDAETNQDAVFISSDVVAVFDGAGGEGVEDAGFRASQAAKKGFENMNLSENFADKSEQNQKEELMKNSQNIAKEIDATGGKTTASFMKIFNIVTGRDVAFVNFGDSAILKIKNGKSEVIIQSDDFWKTLEKQAGGNIIQAVDLIPELNQIILKQAEKKGELEAKDAKAKINKSLEGYIKNNKDQLEAVGLVADFNYKKFVDYIGYDKGIGDEERENIIKHLSYFNKGSMAFLREKDVKIEEINERIKIQAVDEGDVFITASDGLLDNLAPDKIAEILSRYDLSNQAGRDAAAKEVISNLHGVMNESEEYKHDDIGFVITYIGVASPKVLIENDKKE
jgi:serine/threonine protein phosphatase PrpC